VGTSGMKKSRKGGRRRHLDKVGSHSRSAAVNEQEREREAVLDTMGLGGASGFGRTVVWIVFGLFAVAAVVALLVLTVL
jgi:hypothetical protein